MPVHVNISPDRVTAHVNSAWAKGLFALSEQILTDCNKYVKYAEGTLQDTSYAASKPRDGLLIWDTPYAKRQYWEIQTALKPGRTWKWCETAKNRHLEEWQRIAQKGMDENL